MQPDRSMVAQRGASAPTEEGEREGPLGPEQTALSAVPNDQMQLMKMMQQNVICANDHGSRRTIVLLTEGCVSSTCDDV